MPLDVVDNIYKKVGSTTKKGPHDRENNYLIYRRLVSDLIPPEAEAFKIANKIVDPRDVLTITSLVFQLGILATQKGNIKSQKDLKKISKIITKYL